MRNKFRAKQLILICAFVFNCCCIANAAAEEAALLGCIIQGVDEAHPENIFTDEILMGKVVEVNDHMTGLKALTFQLAKTDENKIFKLHQRCMLKVTNSAFQMKGVIAKVLSNDKLALITVATDGDSPFANLNQIGAIKTLRMVTQFSANPSQANLIVEKKKADLEHYKKFIAEFTEDYDTTYSKFMIKVADQDAVLLSQIFPVKDFADQQDIEAFTNTLDGYIYAHLPATDAQRIKTAQIAADFIVRYMNRNGIPAALNNAVRSSGFLDHLGAATSLKLTYDIKEGTKDGITIVKVRTVADYDSYYLPANPDPIKSAFTVSYTMPFALDGTNYVKDRDQNEKAYNIRQTLTINGARQLFDPQYFKIATQDKLIKNYILNAWFDVRKRPQLNDDIWYMVYTK